MQVLSKLWISEAETQVRQPAYFAAGLCRKEPLSRRHMVETDRAKTAGFGGTLALECAQSKWQYNDASTKGASTACVQ